MRPEASQARTSLPRDNVGATALPPLLYIGQMAIDVSMVWLGRDGGWPLMSANTAHIRQSRPDSGPGFLVQVLDPLKFLGRDGGWPLV